MTIALGGRVFAKSDSPKKYPDSIESLVVRDMEDNGFYMEFCPLKIELYRRLKEIIICDGNCSMRNRLVLSNLPLLETLVVGDNSFNLGGGHTMAAAFSVTKCPSLRTITIGDSFRLFTSFELSGCDCGVL